MTLPTGTITMAQVNVELVRPSTQQISLNESAVRTLAGIPAGTISMNNLRGKTNWHNATGGTIVTSGNFRIHVFTSPGTFTITRLGSPGVVDYLVVAGGGGGGKNGGGGAGGLRTGSTPVALQGYGITVGGGGSGPDQPFSAAAPNGANSAFGGLTSSGGGGGGGRPGGNAGPGSPGGSGGGGGWPVASGGSGISGEGNPGGGSDNGPVAGGGGGGRSHGGQASRSTVSGGRGGGGLIISWMPGSYGTPQAVGFWPAGYGTAPPGIYFAGGGGGGGGTNGDQQYWGGVGGGGMGKVSPAALPIQGATNTGGGGGGQAAPGFAGNGGSGIVAIRYQFQG
jgi:hypothetical protein